MNEKLAYSITEAAAVLGVSRGTVYTLIHRDDFPKLKIGSRTLIPCARLAEWIEAQAAQGGKA